MLLERLIKFFTSLRLTVVLLVLSLVLVFIGTLGEVHLGLYKAQTEFFRSFFIYWHPPNAAWKIPVFPGGYLLGAALLLNLVSAHVSRFKFSRDKIGLWIIHAGLILLILGQLATDMLAVESQMHLRQGQMKNYSESDRLDELAITDITDKKLETVVAIPQRLLAGKGDLHNDQLPFVVRVKEFYANSCCPPTPRPAWRASMRIPDSAPICGGSRFRGKQPWTAATCRRHSWKWWRPRVRWARGWCRTGWSSHKRSPPATAHFKCNCDRSDFICRSACACCNSTTMFMKARTFRRIFPANCCSTDRTPENAATC